MWISYSIKSGSQVICQMKLDKVTSVIELELGAVVYTADGKTHILGTESATNIQLHLQNEEVEDPELLLDAVQGRR
jgi:hypothetical protein